MQVVYNGSYAAVQVPALNNQIVKRGEPVEVDDKIGKSLLRQSSWTEHKEKPAPKPVALAEDKEVK